MNDNDIIEALGQCETQKTCSGCPYFEKIGCKKHLYQDAFNLINRQKAEIERYLFSIKLLESDVKAARTEAIKDFAERLKGKSIVARTCENSKFEKVTTISNIDNLVEEMVGE